MVDRIVLISLGKAPTNIIISRLQHRYNSGTEEEKDVRQKLGELDKTFIETIASRYQTLKEEGWFTHVLDTSTPVDITVKKLFQIHNILSGHQNHK
jgi:hypothetical protein